MSNGSRLCRWAADQQRAHALMATDPGQYVIVRHVLVEGVLDLPVVQQPVGTSYYVSSEDGVLTQFSTVTLYKNIGLLAHNYLAGRVFSEFEVGQLVQLMYESGEIEPFVVTEILRYQALEPNSPFSSFQNVEEENETLSVSEMFSRVYEGERHVTFQTCITRNGKSSWGRLFVIAEPVERLTELQVMIPQTGTNTSRP